MDSRSIIEADNLTKTYNGFTAVEDLTIRVEEGEIYGFLGPNGAGKTTTILMLLGLTEPTSGIARVCGYNSSREPLRVKRVTGYLPENLGFYEDLTATENLRYIARLNNIPGERIPGRISELLELVGIPGTADQKIETFSKGMKQRLGIAAVLIKEPSLIILDEPTAGLDPEGASSVLDLIVRLSQEQKITVLLSSHLLHQVQKICHRVGILSRGRLVAEGPVSELEAQLHTEGNLQVEIEMTEADSRLVDSLKQIEGVTDIKGLDNKLVVTCERDIRSQLARGVIEGGGSLIQMNLLGRGLEEIYLKYFHEEGK